MGEEHNMRKVIVSCLFISVLFMASAVRAEEVLVTPKGTKYHLATCPLIKNKETATMEKAEAEAKKLKPCTRCFKAKAQKSAVSQSPEALKVPKKSR